MCLLLKFVFLTKKNKNFFLVDGHFFNELVRKKNRYKMQWKVLRVNLQ